MLLVCQAPSCTRPSVGLRVLESQWSDQHGDLNLSAFTQITIPLQVSGKAEVHEAVVRALQHGCDCLRSSMQQAKEGQQDDTLEAQCQRAAELVSVLRKGLATVEALLPPAGSTSWQDGVQRAHQGLLASAQMPHLQLPVLELQAHALICLSAHGRHVLQLLQYRQYQQKWRIALEEAEVEAAQTANQLRAAHGGPDGSGEAAVLAMRRVADEEAMVQAIKQLVGVRALTAGLSWALS